MSDPAPDLAPTSRVGGVPAPPSGDVFHAVDPATGAALGPPFHTATPDDVDRAARLAADAFRTTGRASGPERAALLRRIADGLDAAADAVVARARLETALAEPRLRGELARTTGQLRLFARVAEEGAWADARIDHADPARTPPKPDVRSVLRPLGPVAVFGASNFPLAFSTAGGDTASALAAGCPVVVKGHPAHPGTAALVGAVVAAAVAAEGWPAGTFALLHDGGVGVGLALVRHPAVAAVGFTGSQRAGLALVREGAARAVPIPVYAEMGSVNPVVVLPEAARGEAGDVARALAASVVLGAGQFCTNPGLVFVPAGADAFVDALETALAAAAAAPMLTAGIAAAYESGVEGWAAAPGVRCRTRGVGGATAPALFETDGAAFRAAPALADEVFGPATLVVRYRDAADLREALDGLGGGLTATLHATAADLAAHPDVLAALEARAGRVLFGGVPTGVEVNDAVVHGGPFPATSDGRSTSVGTRAILRWARPVCWQDAPDAVLPPELREANPLGVPRLVDGRHEPAPSR